MALLHKELYGFIVLALDNITMCVWRQMGIECHVRDLFIATRGFCTFTRLDRNKTHLLFGDRWDANFLLHCKFASVQYTDLSKIHVHIVQKSRSYLCLFTRLMNFYLFARTKSHRYSRCKLYWINKKFNNFIWRKKDNFLDSFMYFFLDSHTFAIQNAYLNESYTERKKFS